MSLYIFTLSMYSVVCAYMDGWMNGCELGPVLFMDCVLYAVMKNVCNSKEKG